MHNRTEISLTKQERQDLRRLQQEPDVAWSFWQTVCDDRDLDYKTVLLEDLRPSALPKGHGKYWCWPVALQCKDDPKEQLKFLNLED